MPEIIGLQDCGRQLTRLEEETLRVPVALRTATQHRHCHITLGRNAARPDQLQGIGIQLSDNFAFELKVRQGCHR